MAVTPKTVAYAQQLWSSLSSPTPPLTFPCSSCRFYGKYLAQAPAINKTNNCCARGNIVAKPTATLLLNKQATVSCMTSAWKTFAISISIFLRLLIDLGPGAAGCSTCWQNQLQLDVINIKGKLMSITTSCAKLTEAEKLSYFGLHL